MASSGDTQQLSFAQRLAHSSDSGIRDDTVATLAKWLHDRASAEESEYLKLWKALFYTVWHSDKVPVQQDLVFRLAGLLRSLRGDDPRAVMLLHTFFVTMRREWIGIDHLRLDKFMSLIRRMLGEGLRMCAGTGWAPPVLASFAGILRDDAMADRPDGIRYHVVDVLVDEICAVVPAISTEQLLVVLSPFLEHCKGTDNRILFDRIVKDVFESIVERIEAVQVNSTAGGGEDDDAGAVTAPATAAPAGSRVSTGAAAGKKRPRPAAAASETPLVIDAEERARNTRVALRHVSLGPLAVAVWRIAADPGTAGGLRETLYALHARVADAAVAAGHIASRDDVSPVEQLKGGKAAAHATSAAPTAATPTAAAITLVDLPSALAQQSKSRGKKPQAGAKLGSASSISAAAASTDTITPASFLSHGTKGVAAPAATAAVAAGKQSKVKRARGRSADETDDVVADPLGAFAAIPTVAELRARMGAGTGVSGGGNGAGAKAHAAAPAAQRSSTAAAAAAGAKKRPSARKQ